MLPPTTRNEVYLEMPHLLVGLDVGTKFAASWLTVGGDGLEFMPTALTWLNDWLNVELLCWLIDGEDAVFNGANVNPDDENADCGLSGFCCVCVDGGLNGE